MVYCLAAFLSRNYFSILSPTTRDQEEKSLFVNPTLAFRPLFESVRFSSSVVSDSLWPHGLQHTRPPCLSPTPRDHPTSCHPTISSSAIPPSVVLFSSGLQSFPTSGSLQMSQFFASGGQSIGVSALVLPMNIQDWFPLGLTDWISLQSKELLQREVLQLFSKLFSKESSPTPQFKSIDSLVLRFLYNPTLTSIHDYWKNHSFD